MGLRTMSWTQAQFADAEPPPKRSHSGSAGTPRGSWEPSYTHSSGGGPAAPIAKHHSEGVCRVALLKVSDVAGTCSPSGTNPLPDPGGPQVPRGRGDRPLLSKPADRYPALEMPVDVAWARCPKTSSQTRAISGVQKAAAVGHYLWLCTAFCQPSFRAAPSIAGSLLSKFVPSILSITGPISWPIGPPLGTYR